MVRAFVTDASDVPVTDTVEQGRDAWRLVTPVVPNKLAGPGGSGDQLEVVVDRESGFPLRITESLEGRFLHQVTLSGLVADEPVDPDTFSLEFPDGVEVFRRDAGFRRVTVDQAAAIVGYRPLLPTDLPDGFERAEVTAAAEGPSTGTEGMNPAAPGVVSVAYRRGFDRIVVTTRLTDGIARCNQEVPGSGASACWADPLSSGEGFVDEPEPFVVDDGALAGSDAELVLSPGVPPTCGPSTTAWWSPSPATPRPSSSGAWRSPSRRPDDAPRPGRDVPAPFRPQTELVDVQIPLGRTSRAGAG